MPTLQNIRHERFAQALAQGKSGDLAYSEAGYKPNKDNASRLKAHESILRRVAELQAKAAIRVEITIEGLVNDLMAARDMAMQDRNPNAAVQAIKEMAVLSGLRVERRENRNINASDMDDAELAHIAAGGGEGVASAPGYSQKPH